MRSTPNFWSTSEVYAYGQTLLTAKILSNQENVRALFASFLGKKADPCT